VTFYAWLCQQVDRTDDVGTFARFAVKDRIFPRPARKLNLFLQRYEGMPVQRAGAKLAHREWRKARRVAA
jgi:hypothetical protein